MDIIRAKTDLAHKAATGTASGRLVPGDRGACGSGFSRLRLLSRRPSISPKRKSRQSPASRFADEIAGVITAIDAHARIGHLRKDCCAKASQQPSSGRPNVGKVLAFERAPQAGPRDRDRDPGHHARRARRVSEHIRRSAQDPRHGGHSGILRISSNRKVCAGPSRRSGPPTSCWSCWTARTSLPRGPTSAERGKGKDRSDCDQQGRSARKLGRIGASGKAGQ